MMLATERMVRLFLEMLFSLILHKKNGAKNLKTFKICVEKCLVDEGDTQIVENGLS